MRRITGKYTAGKFEKKRGMGSHRQKIKDNLTL